MMMNQHDIQMAYANQHACPNVRKGFKLLHSLMEAVNSQSDGWAYWNAPSKSAEKLMTLLKTAAGNLWYDTHGTISAADLRKAITPIRSMVTRQAEKQKKYGNTFEFDVDAALKD